MSNLAALENFFDAESANVAKGWAATDCANCTNKIRQGEWATKNKLGVTKKKLVCTAETIKSPVA